MFCLLTTGNAWNITASEYCIPTSCSDIVISLASYTLSAGRRLGSLRSGEGLETIALPELLTMNFALAIAADNLNYTTVFAYGGALY